MIGPKSSGEDGGRRVRVERVGVLGVMAGVFIVLDRAVDMALDFLGAGGVSDSSSRIMVGRLGLGLAGERLRFSLRGGFGMSRWIQRRSANKEGISSGLERHKHTLYATYVQSTNTRLPWYHSRLAQSAVRWKIP